MRQQAPFLSSIQKTVGVLLRHDRQKSMNKGHDFEKYIANLFELKMIIINRSTDHSDKRAGIKVGSDIYQYFLIR